MGLENKPPFRNSRFMDNQIHKPSSRRTLYQKFSDKVFATTGMPLARVVVVILGLTALGGSIYYAMRDVDESSLVDAKAPDTNDFLKATALAADFSALEFPVQIEKLDWMIDRCDELLQHEGDYKDRLKEKLLGILALKAMLAAHNGVDPAAALSMLENRIDQMSASPAEKDARQYLMVGSYMNVLASNSDLDLSAQATAAISAITEATPVPTEKAVASFNAALKYYERSKDKVEAGNLVRLLGKRMALAKEKKISDFGNSLVDYTHYFSCYQGSLSQSNSGNTLESETTQLEMQLLETPPLSVQTYNVLMNVPQRHLHAGNQQRARKILDQLTSAASISDERIRDAVLPRLAKFKTRVDLFGSPFPFSGYDTDQNPIELPDAGETHIVFVNPLENRSKNALNQIVKSPLHEGGKTYLASATGMSDKQVRYLQNLSPIFTVVDEPTAKDWFEKSGIEKVPYLIKLDKAGIVQSLRFP
jgi:hypothetical protein